VGTFAVAMGGGAVATGTSVSDSPDEESSPPPRSRDSMLLPPDMIDTVRLIGRVKSDQER
jgi:hypothetical protein